MFIIKKQFHFSASHILLGLPLEHPCGRLHGHNYIVEVVLENDKLDERGFVLDYGELKFVKQYIDEHLDHRHLNDVLTETPTAENIAKYLYAMCVESLPGESYKYLKAVRVSETPKTWAEYNERG